MDESQNGLWERSKTHTLYSSIYKQILEEINLFHGDRNQSTSVGMMLKYHERNFWLLGTSYMLIRGIDIEIHIRQSSLRCTLNLRFMHCGLSNYTSI